jgi:Rap1-interacting factor 1 N terminal
MVEVLSTFPARPPTPPRASHALFKRDGEPQPGESATPTAESTILRSNKKVNFSPITSYIKPPSFSNHASKPAAEIRSLLPSNECKPTKSILKATSSSLLASDMAPGEQSEPQSFTVLLESTTQQLAGESLSSRVDAYMQLLGALKAYEDIPEQDAMASKLGLLLQFVQRDITRDLGKGDLVEMNLVINALKLGLYIIWSDSLVSQIPDDFKIFIVDHCLSVLQEGKLPKSILNHYIHILYTQNFSAKTMTQSRVTRILAVLNDITDRVNGNGIVSHRLVVYTRLISQSRLVMASQASLWVENFISGLLHPVKDTRSKSLILGNKVALLLGPNLNISKCILDIFNKELSEGRKLVSEICERMSRMTLSIDSGVHVPQIWSIIILLLRSKRFNIEQWEYFKEWVLVLQKCLNCSEPAIKSQAIIGWNKFVYVVSCNESTSTSMLKMLTKPILSQPERKRNEKAGANITPLFLASYYNLIYYSFRPSTPYEHIDFIWEEYISQPFNNKFANSPQLDDAAYKVLASLLWTPQQKVWTDSKINEVSRMDPEYIVPIDCRWIRSRIVVVVGTFEALLPSSTWKYGNDSLPNVATAWVHICKALADASSKEIKPSTELMQAIATILGLFQRLLHGAPTSLNAKTNDSFLERFSFLSTTAISAIGPSPFTEKLLLKTSQETFQAANTPTHRRSHANGNLDTPFVHILRMLSSFDKLSEPSQTFVGLIDGLLEVASKGRQSRSSRLDFLEKCTETSLLKNETNEPNSPLISYIWEATAKSTMDCLASLPMETLRDRDGTLSRDYGNITSILVRGLQSPTAFMTWNSLLNVYVRIIRTERGERGILTLVIEPIANELIQLDRERTHLPLKALVNQASSLSYYQQVNFPPTSTSSNYGSSVFLPEKLLGLLEKFITESYEQFVASESPILAEVIESLTSLLGSGALQFRFILLAKLQGSLSLWLRDSAHSLTAENRADSRLLTSVSRK